MKRFMAMVAFAISLNSLCAPAHAEGRWSHLKKSEAGEEPRPVTIDGTAEAPKVSLTQEQQRKILDSRAKTGSMLGSFYEFGNLLYCSGESWMATTNKEVAAKQLNTIHPSFYRPTVEELFDAAARQTGTTYRLGHYGGWLFEPPAMPLPYTLTLADGWKADNRDLYVAYIPQVQPVGMDIYMLGRYSGLSADDESKVRADLAMRFARSFDKSASAKNMDMKKVDGADALFFQADSPARPGNKWRQWAFVKNGFGFVIVSSIDKANEDKLLPDVEKMVGSFHLATAASSKP